MARPLDETMLSALESELRGQGVSWVDAVLPGLSDTELDATFSAVGLELPDELRTWFGWRNGVPVAAGEGSEARLLGRYEYLPLESALELYERRRRSVEAAELEEPTLAYGRSWFPVVGINAYAVICDCTESTPTSIVRAGHISDVEPPVVAESMGEMVMIWIQALQSGAWVFDGALPARWQFDPTALPSSLRENRLV